MFKLNLVERVGIVNLPKEIRIILDTDANSNLPESEYHQPVEYYQKPVLKKQTAENFPNKTWKYNVRGKR